jgi:CRISPR system Cascade subunit CasA
VALQNYAVGGLVSFAKGEDPSRYKSAYAAPLVRGALTLVKGDNLFETLLLNLCRYDPRNGWPFAFEPDRDRPAWEAPPPTVIQEREPHGYLDYLTWQSRRVLLCPEQDADGAVMIRQVVIMKGNQFADGWVRKKAEVMQAFRAIEKPAAGQEPWLPVGFREDRALWRDSHAFLQSLDGKTERPAIFDWVSVLVEGGIIARARRVPVDLYGMSTDKAKVLFWRHERMILPLAYLQNKDLRNALGVALNKAEDVGKALNFATLELARLMLAPAADQAAGRQPAPEDERRLADSLAPGRVYWAHLDTAFRLLLQDLAAAAEQDPDVEPEHTLPMQTWLTTLRQSVWAAFNTLTNSLD